MPPTSKPPGTRLEVTVRPPAPRLGLKPGGQAPVSVNCIETNSNEQTLFMNVMMLDRKVVGLILESNDIMLLHFNIAELKKYI